ncbi:XdhC family protein [Porticoccaceae bacterium]|nr:XdhC family protein [Porticoccaceae bacterium]
MTNHLTDVLDSWYDQRNTHEWVLGTVYQTKGPCYRRPGAMALFNSMGQQFGLLSGGCLEKELCWQAARVMQSQAANTLCYDGSDDDDLSVQLGIGCGGTVWILLQPVSADNNYLGLADLRARLKQEQCGYFWQRIPEQGEVEAKVLPHQDHPFLTQATLREIQGQTWLVTPIKPAIHLLVVGGGEDARPLVTLAKDLGWRVTLCDSRPANARSENFPKASAILRCKSDRLSEEGSLKKCDAAVVMSHNLTMDAEAILSLQCLSSLQYLALLGPETRKRKVLSLAGLSEQALAIPVSGPAGLCLGGELPESIALSILAECHAVLHQANALSISGLKLSPDTKARLSQRG